MSVFAVYTLNGAIISLALIVILADFGAFDERAYVTFTEFEPAFLILYATIFTPLLASWLVRVIVYPLSVLLVTTLIPLALTEPTNTEVSINATKSIADIRLKKCFMCPPRLKVSMIFMFCYFSAAV